MEFDTRYSWRYRHPGYEIYSSQPRLPGHAQHRTSYQETFQTPDLYSHLPRHQVPLVSATRRRKRGPYEFPGTPGRLVRRTSPPPRRGRYSGDEYNLYENRIRSRSSSTQRRLAPRREVVVENDSNWNQASNLRRAHTDTIDLTRPLGEAPELSTSVPQPNLEYGIPGTEDNGNRVTIIEDIPGAPAYYRAHHNDLPAHMQQFHLSGAASLPSDPSAQVKTPTKSKRSGPVVEEDVEGVHAEAPGVTNFSTNVPIIEAAPQEYVDDQEADLAAYENFNFVFPNRSPATDSSREMDTSDSEIPELEEPQTSPRVSSQTLAHGTVERVFSSYYQGDYEIGANHNVILTELHDPKGQTEPLFRWLHIQQTMMNFNELWMEVSKMSQLSEYEKTALSKVRAELAKSCVKTRHNFKGDEVGYVEPRAFEVPIPVTKGKTSSQPKYVATVKWICLPYFALKGDGGLMSASSSTAFPSQTLSQAQFSRSDPQRDAEQAVRQLGLSKKGGIFHIAQLWCIVVQNSILITCGTMNISDLQGTVIKFGSVPSPKPALALSSGRILVSYGPEVIWSISASECTTWFSFTSRFAKTWWPNFVKFTLRGREITAKEWPKITNLASKPKAKVTLCLEKTAGLPPFTRGCPLYNLNILNQSRKGRFGYLNDLDDESEYLHLLLLQSADSRQSSKPPQISWEALKVQLAAAELYLTEETAYTTRSMYNSAPEADREEVYITLKDLESRADAHASQDFRNAFETRIDIVNSAELLYRFFVPAQFEGPTTRKFWGALKGLLQVPHPSTTRTDAFSERFYEHLSERLRTTVENIPMFQSIFAYSSDEDRAQMTLPQELANAWLHVVIGTIFAARGNEACKLHYLNVEYALEQGMQKMLEDLPSPSLLESAAMLPMEILALSMAELLRDQVGKSDDILETYSEYLNVLDNDITNKPSDRAYQHSIDLAQQEMKVIKWNLAKQQWIISRVMGMVHAPGSGDLATWNHGRVAARERAELAEPPPYHGDERHGGHGGHGDLKHDDGMFYMAFDNRFADEMASASKLSPTDPGVFRGLFLLECARLVEQREYEFKRFTEYAEELERAVAYKMDWTKDRQENAIYAFTLVTIIFLPLSAISSIFGMNTTDVRDMKQGQWLYWAVALPVTLLVIIIGLWWMNELDNLVGWAMGRQTSRASPSYGTAAAIRVPESWHPAPETRPADGNVGYDGTALPPPQSPAYDASIARPAYGFHHRRHDTSFSPVRRRRTRY